jgi:hypothetical protein
VRRLIMVAIPAGSIGFDIRARAPARTTQRYTLA